MASLGVQELDLVAILAEQQGARGCRWEETCVVVGVELVRLYEFRLNCRKSEYTTGWVWQEVW